MESTRSEIKYEIERSQNKKRNANDTRYGRTGARCGRSPGESRLAFSTEKVSSAAIAGFSSGLLEAASLKGISPQDLSVLRVLIGMKQGGEEVLGLGEMSLDVKEKEVWRRAY